MAEKVSGSFALALFISLVCVSNISALTEQMMYSMHLTNFEFVDTQKASNGKVSSECMQTLATVKSNAKQRLMCKFLQVLLLCLLGFAHTMLEKFENASLGAKTEQKFCVHTNG